MHYVITAGHSNTDPGAVGNGYREADIALVMRELVAMKLRQRGHTVTTDGGGKTNLPLSEAVKLAKRGDVAVEIHCNASHSPTARGVETIALPKDKALAQRISQSIAAVTGQRLRGDAGWIDQAQSARGRLAFVQAGGLIVELFFISNPDEVRMWEQKHWLIATAIADALEGW